MRQINKYRQKTFKYQECCQCFSEQDFSELSGLVPHRAHEESHPNQHIDVDTDKVKINVKRSANAVQN